MKTFKNHNTKQFLKSAGAIAMALCITTGSAFATTHSNDSVKTKKSEENSDHR